MSQIASKNLYDLLGNDPEQDPDRAPDPPTKVADIPVQRAGKRNGAGEGPAAGGRGGRPAQFGGRGDEAGSLNNRSEQRGDGPRQDRPNRGRGPREGGEYRGRGTRGGPRGSGGRTFRSGRDDRQSHSGVAEHEKQAALAWGNSTDGNAELGDEKAGEAIANAEARNESNNVTVPAGDPALADGPDGETGANEVAVEEDNTKSYDQYLAEQAEKRLALGGGSLEARKANEGSKQSFPGGPAFARNPEEENFIVGAGGKARREKNQKGKDLFNLEGNYYAAPDAGDRGGRGRGRGGRGGGAGRGEFRGDRGGERGGRGGGRGRGEFRGEFRGGRGDRAERGGAPRGGAPRGGLNPSDQSAFPALGGS